MHNRYAKSNQFNNQTELYEHLRDDRNLKNLYQFETFNFGNLRNVENYNFDYITHTVQPFERLYTISQKYYKAPEYGWVILYTNGLANELEINPGDILKIYIPLDKLLGLL